jgi:E-phenylitaconyl-CoA hydratase
MSIELSVSQHVATLTLAKSERLNAIDQAMRQDLRQAWSNLAADERVRVIVLTGAGDRAFCAGVDLKEQGPAENPAQNSFAAGAVAAVTFGMDIDKPIIAAVNGVALGGGFELALASDIRLASQAASFALTEVKVGSMPGAGGTQRLVRAIPRSDAMLMLLTGRKVDAEEALRIGLVSAVHAHDRLLEEALALAAEIAECAPLAVSAVKRVVRAGDGLPLDAALQIERLAFGLIRTSEDRLEGRKAFRERRKPKFRGA